MTDRENVIGLIRRTGYETLPTYYSMVPNLQEQFEQYCRETGYQPPEPQIISLPFIRPELPREDSFWRPWYNHKFKEGTVFDDYGVAWEPGSEACFHMRKMYHPLEEMETLEELQSYPYPIYMDHLDEEQQRVLEAYKKKDKFLLGNLQCTIWEAAWYMRGMEQLMMDMLEEPELANFVLDVTMQNSIRRACAYAAAGADAVFLGDDIGMQKTGLMSLELYRTYLKPRLKQVIDAAKAVKPDLIVFYHSCGYVTPFVEDLIEAGVDVLNPVQPESMNFEEIYKTYQDRLSFCGVLGTQTLMPFGTPEEVRQTLFRYMDLVGPKGGLIACPTHIMEPEVPVENVVAYLEACSAYQPVR